jgi:Ser/Thr protein kinase RdoA (MazF antagonist)
LENANYNNQVRQLRILAEAALTHYDIGTSRLALLSHRGDTMFRVTTQSRPGMISDDSSERFVLRLCDPQKTNRDSLQSELFWLSAVRHDTDLVIPEPVLTRNGALITEIEVEDISQVRYCALFRWVEGRFVDQGLSSTLFERVGTFMARLHLQSRHYVPPDGFVRPRWNWHWLFGRSSLLDDSFVTEYGRNLIGKREMRLVHALKDKIETEILDIPTSSDYYGLIHADLQQRNYLFYKGEVRAIDFHDCCWGYYLLDIAITLSGISGRKDERQLQEAFLKGYKLLLPLPDHYEAYLYMFMALQMIVRVNALLRADENQYDHNSTSAYLSYAFDWLDKYVNVPDSGPFAVSNQVP